MTAEERADLAERILIQWRTGEGVFSGADAETAVDAALDALQGNGERVMETATLIAPNSRL